MWIRCRAIDIHQLLAVKTIIPKCSRYLKVLSEHKVQSYCYRCRHLSTRPRTLRNQSQYQYDPKSDSFVPKGHNPSEDGRGDQKGTVNSFLKQFCRNVFLLTGAIVWCGVIFVTLFVDIEDIEEEDLNYLQLKDGEEEVVRMSAFYHVGNDLKELAQHNALVGIKNRDDIIERLGQPVDDKIIEWLNGLKRTKGLALHNALGAIKNQDVIIEWLGKPVQLIGYRAAAKLIQQSSQFNLESLPIDTSIKSENIWCAECVLEGPKGLVLLTLEFEKLFDKEVFVLTKVTVDMLGKSGSHLLELTGSVPEGVNFK